MEEDAEEDEEEAEPTDAVAGAAAQAQTSLQSLQVALGIHEPDFGNHCEDGGQGKAEQISTELNVDGGRSQAPNSIRDVLQGFENWKGQADDTHRLCLDRLVALRTRVSKFIEEVRISEGFLSRSSVEGSTKLNEANCLSHELALARQAHNLCASRSSRYSQWASFSKRAAEVAAGDHESGTAPAQAITAFLPATGFKDPGLVLFDCACSSRIFYRDYYSNRTIF